MALDLHRFPRLCLAAGLCVSLIATPVAADVPRSLADIQDSDTEWGSEQLRHRGFTLIERDHHDGKMFEYWWQSSSLTCVQARSDHGTYERVKTTSATDCNQYHTSTAGKSDNKDDNNAAAIAIGAAAILGAVALAHKSHDRDDKHGQDSKSVSEFDRGYRDGLHHESYHNFNDTTAYSDGYAAGQRDRKDQTSYRSGNDGRHSGYQPYVNLNDLVDARASSADDELRERGFRDTGGYKQDGKSYVTWYNRSTRQCVQAVTKDGRIKHIDPINEGNCQ